MRHTHLLGKAHHSPTVLRDIVQPLCTVPEDRCKYKNICDRRNVVPNVVQGAKLLAVGEPRQGSGVPWLSLCGKSGCQVTHTFCIVDAHDFWDLQVCFGKSANSHITGSMDNEDRLWNAMQEEPRLFKLDKGTALKRNLLRWPGQTSLRSSQDRNWLK